MAAAAEIVAALVAPWEAAAAVLGVAASARTVVSLEARGVAAAMAAVVVKVVRAGAKGAEGATVVKVVAPAVTVALTAAVVDVDGTGAGRRIGAAHKLRQTVISLRPYNDIDPWRAAGDFLALCLSDATCNSDGDVASLLVAGVFLHNPESTEFGENFLGRLLTDMACVDDDHVRPVRL